MDPAQLSGYLGRNDGEDEISIQPLRALSATLDHEQAQWQPGDPLPPAWQWLYFLPLTPQSQLDKDGHAHRDGVFPEIAEARRMYAGGRMYFQRPVLAGDTITRQSTVLDVVEKEGRSGKLVFITLGFNYFDAQGLALEEQQDLVFRLSGSIKPPAGKKSEIPPSQWQSMVTPDSVMLFRFSALTFNGHRIHFDLPYTRNEGYPDLLVHGPLIAILLLDLAARNASGRRISSFSFRALEPVFVNSTLTLCGNPSDDGSSATLAAYRNDGALAMTAEIVFSPDNNGVPLTICFTPAGQAIRHG